MVVPWPAGPWQTLGRAPGGDLFGVIPDESAICSAILVRSRTLRPQPRQLVLVKQFIDIHVSVEFLLEVP